MRRLYILVYSCRKDQVEVAEDTAARNGTGGGSSSGPGAVSPLTAQHRRMSGVFDYQGQLNQRALPNPAHDPSAADAAQDTAILPRPVFVREGREKKGLEHAIHLHQAGHLDAAGNAYKNLLEVRNKLQKSQHHSKGLADSARLATAVLGSGEACRDFIRACRCICDEDIRYRLVGTHTPNLFFELSRMLFMHSRSSLLWLSKCLSTQELCVHEPRNGCCLVFNTPSLVPSRSRGVHVILSF